MSDNSRTRDYYADLGLTRDASATQIQEAYHRLAKLHHPAENRSNSDGGACEFHKAQEAYEKLYDTVSRAQYDEEMREKIDDAEARPFNVFNPRPRLSSPINTPRRTSPSTKPLANPNVKFHDIGSEFEEEQPEFANASRNKGRRNDPQGYTASRAHGRRVLMTDHPAADNKCTHNLEEWQMQAGTDYCIFCLSFVQGTYRCPACEAVGCSRCLPLSK